MKRASLYLLSTSHTRPPLRTPVVTGTFLEAPEVGNSFTLFAPALEEGDLRTVTTSVVRRVATTSRGWEIQTMNSRYEVVLEPDV